MKLILITGLLALSGIATAQTCKLEMYGPRGEFITSIRTPRDPQCLKAARSCHNWRAWYYAPSNSQCYMVQDDGYAIIDYERFPDYDVYYGYPGSPYTRIPRTPPTTTTTTSTTTCRYDRYGREICQTTTTNPETNREPTTRPNPTPTPTTPTAPNPSPDSDAIRPVEAGETVIFNSKIHMVVSVENANFYHLKPMGGRNDDIVKDVARQYVAITRGCHAGFCVTDSVITLTDSSFAAVAAIEYDGQLVTKTLTRPEKMNFDVNPVSLAWTKGCSPEGSKKVCVGNGVMMNNSRLYYSVVGIQLDGKVVIENKDGPKKLTVNINPATLLIVQ